ncbi:MAG TPA: hypothetical protein VE967_07705, partial [Gemmatimonadaceae bacterium]|nr:hypothetical protein [Gemmatimonadaceae bacterium]
MDSLRDSLFAAERRFFASWDSAWKFSERDRHQFSTFDDTQAEDGSRNENYHCHAEYKGVRSATTQGRIISSAHGWFSVCPSFDLGDIKVLVDEHANIDQSLTDDRRPAVRNARGMLIAKFDTAARQRPDDDVIAGQRVRLLVDQREYLGALAASRECTGTKWWCLVLGAYARAAHGDVVDAGNAYAAAFAAMPKDVRCEWTDYRLIVDVPYRDDYDVPCAKRDALNERMWWLADPLFIEPGNEREVEQNVRTTLLALRAAPGRGERFDWSDEIGGDARKLLITRYGWPSYMFWGGPLQDRSHTGYLASHLSPAAEPY